MRADAFATPSISDDVAVSIAVTAAVATLGAIASPLGSAELERALAIARSRDVERARFHAAYIFAVKAPTVQTVEVITEFRRAVLITEDHLKQGDWIFGQGGRNLRGENAADALKPTEGRVTIRAHLEFGPHSTYATVPPVEIVVDGMPPLEPLDNRVTPRSSLPVLLVGGRSGQTTTVLVGADVENDFAAREFGPIPRDVRVLISGTEAARINAPFGKLD
jgi:hypothetical protein